MLRGEQKILEMWLDLMQLLYQASKPKLDFKKFYAKVTKTKKCEPQWFMQHEISMEKYDAIIEEFFKNNKVSKREKDAIVYNVHNYGPKFKAEKKKS